MILTAVGNYPKTPNRPGSQKLRTAIQDFQVGKISAEALKAIEEEVTIDVIREQIEAGLDLVTDGHIRWEDEITYFAKGLSGFEVTGLVRYFNTNIYYRQPVAKGKITWSKPVTVSDWQFASQNSTKPVKATLPGPLTLAALSKWDGVYKNLGEATLAAADALQQEAKALQEAGATVIQFDEPQIIFDKSQIGLVQKAFQRILSGLKAKTALYTFFGDAQGIATQLFDVHVNVLGLDFVTTPGNFEVVQAFPKDKSLAAGIVEARNTKLESPGELRSVIDRIARSVSEDRIYVNPTAGLDFLPREVAYEKLKNMCEALRLVTSNS
jgi:5-methyltetrahydropteroyltriglutamate--homocysteine methyltransferase